METTGSKIKHFRTQKNLSQFELEDLLDASNGMISRIENGSINPTKETLFKIASKLELSKKEITFLLGLDANEVNATDIDNAKTKVQDFFEKPTTFAYLLDYRNRIFYLSKGFRFLLDISGIDKDKLIGVTVDEILFDYAYGVRQVIPKNSFDKTAKSVIARWFAEREYILNEPWMQEILEHLKQQEGFNEIWDYVRNNKVDVYNDDSRLLELNVLGTVVSFIYSGTPLISDNRFVVIEYKFNMSNPFIHKLLSDGK